MCVCPGGGGGRQADQLEYVVWLNYHDGNSGGIAHNLQKTCIGTGSVTLNNNCKKN